MESQTPIKMLTGVCKGDSRNAGCVPQVNNTTGVLYGHQVHSTVTDLQTPVYSCATKGFELLKRNVFARAGWNNIHLRL
jgi:hypothetical protein